MYEWPHLAEIFGVDQLARLLAVSPSSVRRHKENARTTPDARKRERFSGTELRRSSFAVSGPEQRCWRLTKRQRGG